MDKLEMCLLPNKGKSKVYSIEEHKLIYRNKGRQVGNMPIAKKGDKSKMYCTEL